MGGFANLPCSGGPGGAPAKVASYKGLSVGAALIALAAALMLGGCSGSQIADHMPTAVGGLPEDAPQRPATEQDYPAVHNMPPTRTTSTLTDEQQKRLQDDLVAARNRYGTTADVPPTTGSTGNASAASAAKP
jgi:hypothetical protein